ncbi:MAG TPA: hypothetical protein GX010_02820 [Erysipelotrichaceae bacterium]|nr:hypothetical protein [Erysipelotrichaceae bacterium]
MKWFDFNDPAFLTFFWVVVSFSVFLLFIVITFILSAKKDKKYAERLKAEATTLRIYIIDPKNNSVIYFNRSNLKNKRQTDMNSFYTHFHANDIDKIKSWIIAICTDYTTAEKYIEADVLFDYGRSTYFSLLKLNKYDPNKGIIHLESFVLKYITPNNYTDKKKNKALHTGVVKRSTMESLVLKEKSLKGFTFAIRFYYIRQKVLSNDKIERYMIVTLKNVIYPFASNPRVARQIIDDGENELLLFDLRISTRDEAMVLATSIAHSIKKCIGVNGFSDSINFSIGVVENAQYYQDFDSMVLKAQEACISAQHHGQEILLYQKQAAPLVEIDRYRDEVEKLMHPSGIRYLFRPIFDVYKKQTLGYFQYVKAYDSPFASFTEMSKYAAKVGMSKQFFATVARYVIPKFASERQDPSLRLFMLVSLQDIDHMKEILSQIPQVKVIKLVLVFEEQEINENAADLHLLNNSLKNLRSDNFELAMLMKDKNLLLDPTVYFNFDYFVAGSMMIGEIKKNNRIRLSIHSLIESLLKYHRPIIATDLEGWQAIELIIKSGVSIVSSETISPSNDMLLPINKKKIDKLVAMDDSYHTGGWKRHGPKG